MKPSEPRITGN